MLLISLGVTIWVSMVSTGVWACPTGELIERGGVARRASCHDGASVDGAGGSRGSRGCPRSVPRALMTKPRNSSKKSLAKLSFNRAIIMTKS